MSDMHTAARAALEAIRNGKSTGHLEDVVAPMLESALAAPIAGWHAASCKGKCFGCLIETLILEAYGNQGVAYLHSRLRDGGGP